MTTPQTPITWTHYELQGLIQRAFAEDLSGGDISTQYLVSDKARATARGVAKAPIVVAGLPVLKAVFATLDPGVKVQTMVADGDSVTPGTTIFALEGSVHSLLAGERTALNFLQHLSGIATLSSQFAELVRDLPVRLVDTRKTLPGWRALQRYAVRVGGCFNHRYNLSAGAMLKENHIRAAGSIRSAVSTLRAQIPHLIKIEVEVTCLEEFREALEAGADVVMLDNMSLEEMSAAVEENKGRALLEASGGIHLGTVRAVAETGVDVISVGALTHSVTAADISLLFDLS